MKLVAGKLIVNAWNATFATLNVFAKLVGDVILTAGKQGRVGLWLMTQIMTHSIFKGGAEMSEFEEIKRPATGPVTELNNAMHSVLKNYRELRAYADNLERENQRILEAGQLTEKVVVPQEVADLVEKLKTNLGCKFSDLQPSTEALTWLNDYQFEDKRFGPWGLNNKLYVLVYFAIIGYTVEPEKKFYLKNIDLSEHDKKVNWFLYKKADGELSHGGWEKTDLPHVSLEKYQFTQSEIDKLHGGYEQIEAKNE